MVRLAAASKPRDDFTINISLRVDCYVIPIHR